MKYIFWPMVDMVLNVRDWARDKVRCAPAATERASGARNE
jgi:hypothetical protein